MEKEKILVTGATGFIGHYVVEELLQRKCYVIASSASPLKAREQPWFSQVEYIPFDLSSTNQHQDLYQYFGSPHRLIHLAWEGLPNYKSSFHLDENLPRHFSFLTNLITHGLKDVTVTGTCFEYGMKEGQLS